MSWDDSNRRIDYEESGQEQKERMECQRNHRTEKILGVDRLVPDRGRFRYR